MNRKGLSLIASIVLLAGVACAQAAPQRPRLFGQRATVQQPALPAGTRVYSNVSYGDDSRQRFDVYRPAQVSNAPVIFMVHGGAWAFGNKSVRGVVENKAARWLPRGFILISIDYRMLPDTPPLAQADDVARALAFAQRHAKGWGGDPSQFIVMGHSAGAHLVSLVSTDAAIAQRNGVQPWLGTISLDSAAMDVVEMMQQRHLPLYVRAFGSDDAGWVAVSPYQQMHGRIVPLLAVCSTRRNNSCPQAQRFAAKAASFGSQAKVLPEDLTHEQINAELGEASAYTEDVEAFMRGLSPVVARALSP
jgi:arylformamidase